MKEIRWSGALQTFRFSNTQITHLSSRKRKKKAKRAQSTQCLPIILVNYQMFTIQSCAKTVTCFFFKTLKNIRRNSSGAQHDSKIKAWT